MRKLIAGIFLGVFVFSTFYPTIYATENELLNESQVEVSQEIAEEDEELTLDQEIETEEPEEVVEENDEQDDSEELPTVEAEPVIQEELQTNPSNLEQPTQEPIPVNEMVKATPENYTGKMNIENPTQNQTLTLPNANTLKVKGWAVSNDSQTTLKVYINNQYIKNATTRVNRPDVDYLVSPAYGGTTNTPKAGFEVDLDMSGYAEGNYTIKVEQVSRQGIVVSKEERAIRITQMKYTGRMNIEGPINNETVTLPNANTLKVKGWAVSNDSQTTLKVYINNQYIKNATTRLSRPDVDSLVSPSYGGTANTPKAGFEADVDISKYAEGNYTIKVEEVSRYGAVICREERRIRIAQMKYTGRMNIEGPTNNETVTLPNANILKVKGWAVSNDSQTTLKVYINNQYIKNATTRLSRPDVDSLVSPAYGGTANTPKAGFEADVDISKYAEGNYTIKVEEVSRYGAVICREERRIRIAQMQYTGRMNIESPAVLNHSLPNQKIMEIKGWAVSNDPGAYMIVLIDGEIRACTVTRTNRPDVDTLVSPSYGGTVNTPKAGVVIRVNIDGLHEGRHVVVVAEVSRFHKIVASSSTIQLNITSPYYTGLMNIETPIANKRYRSDWLRVTGWAITEANGDYIKIFLDGQYQTFAEPVARPDVLNVHGSKYPNHNANVGFVSNICTMGLGEGMHKVTVQQCSKYGKVIQEKEVIFMISNTTTWGVDVSHHNQTINWDAVRNSGINFAILKIGEYRESSGAVLVDSKFEENYAACKARGIAVGGYFYSYAFNPTEAAHEADACTKIISGKSFEMPIFIDIEDGIVTRAIDQGRTSVDSLTNAMITFCDIMNSRGYQAGVYSYKNFFEKYLNTPVLERYNIWLAHYVNATNYAGKYDMWQYTSSGNVGGINGFVDLNWCYKHY